MRRFGIKLLVVLVMLSSGVFSPVGLAQPAPDAPQAPDNSVAELRSYLFIHDTSANMRKRKRIPIMQTSIRAVLDHLPGDAYAGLQAFGHRFPAEGPDACEDTDSVVAMGALSTNREDFEKELNILSEPVIGGGAPVGLALQRGLSELAKFGGRKELYLYMTDLLKCNDPNRNPVEIIQNACQINDLHLTLIGFGLRADLRTLRWNETQKLGCVDLLNLTTNEEIDSLPDKLLTRFSLEFRNAAGQLTDPAPGEELALQLALKGQNGELTNVRQKVKDATVKGTSLELVGLEEGTYVLDVTYQGQKIRAQQEIPVKNKEETREIIRLGKLAVDVTDSEGNPVDEAVAQDLKITILDAGKPVKTVERLANAAFDLLPGNKYKVQISYSIGGDAQKIEFPKTVAIAEGNHQNISIALPLGAIAGQVRDMAGRPAPNVEVLLTEAGLGEKNARKPLKSVATDANGQYFFPDVKAGKYDVSSNQPGYKREKQSVVVTGGKLSAVAELQLFHGIEILAAGVSGAVLADADVTIVPLRSGAGEVAAAPAARIPVTRYHDTYRNAALLPAGEYLVTVGKTDYETKSANVSLRDADPSLDLSFQLAYTITVTGKIVNGRAEPLPDAVLTFRNQGSVLKLPENQPQVAINPDGSFQAALFVTQAGAEKLSLAWKDIYNQEYVKEVTFPLPPSPQLVNLGRLALPVNFLRLTLRDVADKAVLADKITVSHAQSGQSGILMALVGDGVYESTALRDGDYLLRIGKEGYRDVEQKLVLAGGETAELPVALAHYVTVAGTVVNGKDERVAGAVLDFQSGNSTVASLSPVVTGKDGRFQTTLLVKKTGPENVAVDWKSPASGRNYHFETEFELPATPVTEAAPLNLGTQQLPVNFLGLEVRGVSDKGLTGVQVTFTSSRGDVLRGVEFGGGMYESPDLPNGVYTIGLNKEGYKENVALPNVAVGEQLRKVAVGPVILPHYATITGTILNGRDEGLPNVEIVFGGKQSEQLGACRTDPQGRFAATLLVTGPAEETWQAAWKRPEYSTGGGFFPPLHPGPAYGLGEIRLPVNFVSLPVEDVQGKPLRGVTVQVTHVDGSPVKLPEFTIEESSEGIYQAQNLPDGKYLLALQKEGYENRKNIEVTVKGGKHDIQPPIKLGHYVSIDGLALNGKQEPVGNARVAFEETCSTLIRPEGQEPAAMLTTDAEGVFHAQLLVRQPGAEQVVFAWGERNSAAYLLDLPGAPDTQQRTWRLPINFVQAALTDVAGKPLANATVTFTHQLEKKSFPAEERAPGSYLTPGLPDGEYQVLVEKDRYEPQTGVIKVQAGEIRQTAYRLNHYVTVRGHVRNGKGESLAAATVNFGDLKTAHREKIVSATNGIFEAELLVRETGRETGEITWVGKHGTYTKQFWLDLSAQPTVLTLPPEQARLPVNFIALEVKSVAATGVAGAMVKFTQRPQGQVIIAQDLENGNYEGAELPDGTYDIAITKAQYKPIRLENLTVENGEYKIDVAAPRFWHYITMSGIVLNGKGAGVPDALVSVANPQRLQECDPATTRADGSFTLRALVTDVGTETLQVVWQDRYASLVPVTLPFLPEQTKLNPIKLPINFIAVNVQNVFGENLAGAVVQFFEKDGDSSTPTPQNPNAFIAREVAAGRYESGELPDGQYLVSARKEGYIQAAYPAVAVAAGVMAADVTVKLPHVVTVKGLVTDGKNKGVAGAKVRFGGQNSQMQTAASITDDAGYFTERLQVRGTGKETLNITTAGLPYTAIPGDQFALTREIELLAKPGDQELGDLRLSLNFIPVRVQNVAGQGIEDAQVIFTRVAAAPVPPATNAGPDSEQARQREQAEIKNARNLGQGAYEGQHFEDGAYRISVSKEGYAPQESVVRVAAGETATATVFVLPHYVTLSGLVTNGKGDGIPDASLEFDPQNSTVVSAATSNSQIRTDVNGQFFVRLLVKNPGVQRVRVAWQERYSTQWAFQLPAQPENNYQPAAEIRLPVNFAPVRVTNVLGEGLPGVEVSLRKAGSPAESALRLHARGDGLYEAGDLVDGEYALTLQKEGYREAAGKIAVAAGEQAGEQHFVLPHFVTIRGTVVNGKGIGVADAKVNVQGRHSQLVNPAKPIVTSADGSFQAVFLVTGANTSLTENPLLGGSENPLLGGSENPLLGGVGVGKLQRENDSPETSPTENPLLGGVGVGKLQRENDSPETSPTPLQRGNDLTEHLDITWEAVRQGSGQDAGQVFGIARDFELPAGPADKNLGVLLLPANFVSVFVRDISGKGLMGVKVLFLDEKGKEFPAQEFAEGLYEGQNLPDGAYTVKVAKEGYREDAKADIRVGTSPTPFQRGNDSKETSPTPLQRGNNLAEPVTFQLPYYVTLTGTTVDGKGQKIGAGMTLELAGVGSELLPETVVFEQEGRFRAKLLVNAVSAEQLRISYQGPAGNHVRQTAFALPAAPGTVDLQRIMLPVNFIPIELKDLMGYGLTGATVTLRESASEKEIPAQELGNGRYEGVNLLDGTYRITVVKEGYKTAESTPIRLADGIVSETLSFRLRHYVWISGMATNADGEGVREPVIHIEGLRSTETQKRSDLTGKFEIMLEVREVGNEKFYLEWKNTYRTPVIFKLPIRPEKKDLGEIRLPVNFLALLATDISGSTLGEVAITVKNEAGVAQTLQTDANGVGKTADLPNGWYRVAAQKAGYKVEHREVYVGDGKVTFVKLTLPHYVVLRGAVRDILRHVVGGAAVIFEEFTDAEGQKLRTTTDAAEGAFEQELLIDEPKFLEQPRGHFTVKKGEIERLFTFKIPVAPHQVLDYPTLLFPVNYLVGKVVDANAPTIPVPNAEVLLAVVAENPGESGLPANGLPERAASPEALRLTTNALGGFEAGYLQEGEYKITVQKEGYCVQEDFVRIAGPLQEKEFRLQKE